MTVEHVRGPMSSRSSLVADIRVRLTQFPNVPIATRLKCRSIFIPQYESHIHRVPKRSQLGGDRVGKVFIERFVRDLAAEIQRNCDFSTR